ncbi:sigma-70 family RNA polymerase sigma factor [Chitinophaga pendula]|uniref:sigma-70 family RNA polymerase sigma factor n=1 Tax=Chitinophaga TaxID=79328 RepID=UPI000BB0B1D7|nr:MULTISPECIES: sigma-70 family RNA polymerase sigma factor [Chitinophaga]ASZ14118.1 RNA polymerase subunit sigma-24 [Chitinophaga sp. MD30]UCJ08246.1 sigma-70 family RNA polymerase sigma factor [Chitinophaga pendula]
MENYQQVLFPYAYNVLGSAEDAKDAIQDVLSSYITVDKTEIDNEKNYLIKSVINRAINLRKKRKAVLSDNVWLPEPVATEQADNNIHLQDIASYSMLILLEQLNPRERAVFILKEAFGYSHDEVAEVLSTTVENARKLLSRAKAKLKPGNQPLKLVHQPVAAVQDLLEKYIGAIRAGDTQRLEGLFSQDIALFTDGGTKVHAVKKQCFGAPDVASLLVFVYHKYNAAATLEFSTINHQPALIYRLNGRLQGCQVLQLSEDGSHIVGISTVVDPDKLQSLPAGDMAS